MWARRPPRRPRHGAPQAGEILPSTTVRDLVIGSELQLTARGEGELEGIPERPGGLRRDGLVATLTARRADQRFDSPPPGADLAGYSVQKCPTCEAMREVTIGSGAIDSASPAPSRAAIVATMELASACGS